MIFDHKHEHLITLLDGSLHFNDVAKHKSAQLPKNISINLATLPLSTLHEIHQGVANELKVQEQQALMVIKDTQITNQRMCDEKHKDLQDLVVAAVRRVQLEKAISRVCNELPELQIQSKVIFEEKVQQLADAFRESRQKWINFASICSYKLLSFDLSCSPPHHQKSESSARLPSKQTEQSFMLQSRSVANCSNRL